MYSVPDLSVCVLTGLHKVDLLRFLKAILQNNDYLQFEVIVVNQHFSTPVLAAELQDHPEVRFLDYPPEFSKPRSFNLAAKKCNGRYLSFWNQESLPAPGCLFLLADFMDKNPDAGVTVPKLRDKKGIVQPVARNLPGLFSVLYPAGIPGRISSGWNDFASGEASWLTGPGLTINRHLLEEIGAFQENLSVLWPLEFCMRTRKAGWHCYYRNDAQAMADVYRWLGGLNSPGRQIWERLLVAIRRLRFIY